MTSAKHDVNEDPKVRADRRGREVAEAAREARGEKTREEKLADKRGRVVAGVSTPSKEKLPESKKPRAQRKPAGEPAPNTNFEAGEDEAPEEEVVPAAVDVELEGGESSLPGEGEEEDDGDDA